MLATACSVAMVPSVQERRYPMRIAIVGGGPGGLYLAVLEGG